ncbi:MAG: zinc metalloprotease HtpX [Thermoplasmata archaeon]|nr:zinc metalloprotease HtpX [Thermoplasmata archaeon]
MNPNLRIAGLFILLMAIFVLLGWVLGGYFFGDFWWLAIAFFLGIAIAINVIAYFWSDKIIMWSYKAKIVTPNEAPRLHASVRRVNSFYGLPEPRIAIVPSDTPNAFATGRNPKKAVVAVTNGLLTMLNDRELDGVVAHELAHVKNRDVLVMTVAATVAGAIAFLARIFWWNMILGRRRQADLGTILMVVVVAITAPLAALLIRLAISRSREYKADRTGAMTIHRPNDLADALLKMEKANKRKPIARGNPASSSLFIVNPFRGNILARMFSTHPPIQERVKRLRKLATETVSL